MGRQYEERGHARRAAQFYLQAVETNPNSHDAHHRLGSIYLRLGNFSEAITQLQEAVRLYADSADAYNDLGTALGSSGRLQEAINAFERRRV